MGLSLYKGMFIPQLPELADFARAVHDLTIALNHIRGLKRVGHYGNLDDEVLMVWRSGLAAVTQCPNVALKLGGMGQPRYGIDWHEWERPIGGLEAMLEGLAPFMNYCVEQFGPERYMFESNFPPDKASYSYNVLFNAFKLLPKYYSAIEYADLFHDTADRVNRIDV